MAIGQAQDFKLTPKEKKILSDVVMALTDPNTPATVETVAGKVKGNTTSWNKPGENPQLPDKVANNRDSRRPNAEAARTVKIGNNVTMTFEGGKYKIHTQSGDLTVGDGNWDAQTAWRLALMNYRDNGPKNFKHTSYAFRDPDLQALYQRPTPELDKSSKFDKAITKLKSMGITKFLFMKNHKEND